jgi:circadian clock protein KaiB
MHVAGKKAKKAAAARTKRVPAKDEGARALEAAAWRDAHATYVLKLYVAGINSRSSEAIRSITRICEEYLEGRYDLRVIDIYQQPALARGEQIIAAPTLIRKLPLPLRRLIGDMASTEKILVGLDLRPAK